MVLELYIRYAWFGLTELPFDKHARLKVLGDDNILTVSEDITFTPLDLKEQMALIGQTLTHSEKDKELTDEWFAMTEITFLGMHPQLVANRWVGALRHETLWETPQWLKKKTSDPLEVVDSMLRAAANWDEKFFDLYQKNIHRAAEENGMSGLKWYSWETQRLENARAYTYAMGIAHGGDALTTMTTETGLSSPDDLATSNQSSLASNAVNDSAKDLSFGLDSIIYRETVTWEYDQSFTTIWHTQVPFEILTLGETENVQNMPFTRFIYTVPKLSVYFQINASPFQQGLIVAYFAPLASYDDLISQPSFETIYNYEHVRIQPNESATHELQIDMHYYRNVMNTFAGGLGTENFGYVGLFVVTPLTSIGNIGATITISTRFHPTKFTIPRPVPTVAGQRDDLVYTKAIIDRLKKELGSTLSGGNKATFERLLESSMKKRNGISKREAHGAASSKSNTNVTYNIEHVVGSVPIENTIGNSQTTSAEGSLDVSGLPMDKPPLSSGSVPMHRILPSNSKNVRVDPVMAMQYHPEMMHRENIHASRKGETSIETLLAKPTLVFRSTWNKNQTPGTSLLNFPLDSLFGQYPENGRLAVGTPMAILNCFKFWRCDIEFTFEVIKTHFHAGRLVATMGYGTPDIDPSVRNIYYNKIMNFSADNSVEKWVVEWNAGTEYLRTRDGPDALLNHRVQDYSLGNFLLCVHNELRAPDTVRGDVTVLVSYRLLRPQLYEANPYMPLILYTNIEPIPELVYKLDVEGAGVMTETPATPATTTQTPTTTPMIVTPQTVDKVGLASKLAYYKQLAEQNSLTLSSVDIPWDEAARTEVPLRIGTTGAFYRWANRLYTYDSHTLSLKATNPVSHGGEPVNNEETAIVDDQPPPDMTTKSETVLPNNAPCKLMIGRKFEHHTRYLEEFFRRHNPVVLPTNSFIDGSRFFTNEVPGRRRWDAVTIPIDFYHPMAALFKMWSGHIGFHALLRSDAPAYYSLENAVPASNVTRSIPAPITVNVPQWYSIRNPQVAGPKDGWQRSRNNRVYETTFTPNEFFTPLSGHLQYANISVPFNTHYYALPLATPDTTFASDTLKVASKHSDLHLVYQPSYQTETSSDKHIELVVTRAVGDDFKLSCYCPLRLFYAPPQSITNLPSTTVASVSGHLVRGTMS